MIKQIAGDITMAWQIQQQRCRVRRTARRSPSPATARERNIGLTAIITCSMPSAGKGCPGHDYAAGDLASSMTAPKVDVASRPPRRWQISWDGERCSGPGFGTGCNNTSCSRIRPQGWPNINISSFPTDSTQRSSSIVAELAHVITAALHAHELIDASWRP